MTTLQVSFPDLLAQQAQARREANRFFESIGKMHAVRDANITPDVIASEIKAYRAERRALGA